MNIGAQTRKRNSVLQMSLVWKKPQKGIFNYKNISKIYLFSKGVNESFTNNIAEHKERFFELKHA